MQDHVAPNPPTTYNKGGVVEGGVGGFEAESFNNTDAKSENYNHPFARLLESLWPGDWREQLKKMNDGIKELNCKPRPRVFKECTEDEWWKIWGIIIFASKVGKGGLDHLYNKSQKVLDDLPPIDLTEIMTRYRATQLIQILPSAFHGNDTTDPWNPILALVNGFNNNRSQIVAASSTKLMDETMSSWSPTTTKYGGLPFLSFILRKPTPLGTEFKTVACSETGEFDCYCCIYFTAGYLIPCCFLL